MKTKVNDKCIGCGTCVSLTDQKVFDFDDDGRARCVVSVVPSDMEDIVRQAGFLTLFKRKILAKY